MNIKSVISIFAAAVVFGTSAFSASPSPSASTAPSKVPSASPTVSASASPKAPGTAKPSASPSASPSGTAKPDDKKSTEDETKKDDSFPEPHSEAAVLIDRKTGDILYEKNKSEKLYPASTTKMMTAILALENGNLQNSVTATHEAIDPITNKHSHMGIKVGETFTLEQLLYGMLVYSANDAANVIAVHIGGSLDAFVGMMNSKAQELGLSGTHYKNPHGFHDDDHYTTAEDLAVLARYAMQNEKFAEIVKTPMYRIPANDLYQQERVLSTTNHLISRYRNTKYFYKYAVGIKTGFTDEAGNCLVAAATKGDIELISVILKADTSDDGTLYAFSGTTDMYEYAFNHYKYFKMASTDDIVSDSAVYEAKGNTRVVLCPAETLEKLLPSDVTADDITKEISLADKVKAPIKQGDVLGNVVYSCRGKEIGRTNLIAGNDVEKDMVLASVHLVVKIFTSPFFIIPAIIIIVLIIISGNNRKNKRRRRRSKLKYSNYMD